MVRLIPDLRRKKLREMTLTAHPSKEFIDELNTVKRSKVESLATIAEMMGNQTAAAEIRRNEKILGWLKDG